MVRQNLWEHKLNYSNTTTKSDGFDPGLAVLFEDNSLAFRYGPGVSGPELEYRSLASIRPSLRKPDAPGPDPVYSIAMDVARGEDLPELKRRMLLYGLVAYAVGTLGGEPVRSQGHVHAISPHCGWSTPELFEIWQGKAIIYAQQNSGDHPGKCVAIYANAGDKIVVPPAWPHYMVNADPHSRMVFGAWCDREYGFDYVQMRAHHGLAWFPLLGEKGEITWEANPNYTASKLETREARSYPELGVPADLPIYECFRRDPESVQWVSDPKRYEGLWPSFEP